MKRRLLRLLWAVLLLVTVCLLVRLEENWRAARFLARTEASLRAQGEELELSALTPAPVPAVQNFAAAPIMVKLLRIAAQKDKRKLIPNEQRLEDISLTAKPTKPGQPDLGSWEIGTPIDLEKWARYLSDSTDPPNGPAAPRVFAALKKFEPELSEFAAAAARPAAVFPADYTKAFQFEAQHLFVLLRFANVYGLRGAAKLHAGRSDLAGRDLATLCQMQEALRHEPLLISLLVRRTLLHNFMELLWEGLAAQAWSAAQLEEVERWLGQEN